MAGVRKALFYCALLCAFGLVALLASTPKKGFDTYPGPVVTLVSGYPGPTEIPPAYPTPKIMEDRLRVSEPGPTPTSARMTIPKPEWPR